MIAPVYPNLSQTIAACIADGEWTGKLPGKNALATRFGVNHATVLKALKILADAGTVEVVPAKGTYVCNGRHRRRAPRKLHRLIGLVGVNERNPDGLAYFRRFNALARRRGYDLIAINFNSQLFRERPRVLLNFPVDGFVFHMSSLRREQLELLCQERIPIASTAAFPAAPWLDQAGADHFSAYCAAFEKLLALGHRRVGLVEFSRSPEYQGYLDRLQHIFRENLGADFDPELFYIAADAEDYYERYGEDYLRRYLNQAARYFTALPRPPTAIFSFNSTILKRELSQWNTRVPQDVSLVEFRSDVPSSPEAAAMVFHLDERLEWVLNTLIDRLEGAGDPPRHFWQTAEWYDGSDLGRATRAGSRRI